MRWFQSPFESRGFACVFVAATIAVGAATASRAADGPGSPPTTKPARMERVRLSDDGGKFALADSGRPFIPWGFNYLGKFGEIIEESWANDWARLQKDFRDMRQLGVNVARIHLQFGTYMKKRNEIDQEEIKRLQKMLDLARDTGLYLDLTGLGCYHLKQIPDWYDALDEAGRWEAQATWWEAIAKACSGHPAVFCYDLMNEPVVGGAAGKAGEPRWLAGELGGFYFVQRIAVDAGKRTSDQIAEAWIARLTAAIRKQDPRALITVGVIPWAQIWPGAKPIFYSPAARKHLDFVSIHVYPGKGELDKAINAIATYEMGKPIVIEETFPMNCSMEEMKTFVDRSAEHADGWISHYFGHTIEEHGKGAEPAGKITAAFFEYWRERGKTIGQVKRKE